MKFFKFLALLVLLAAFTVTIARPVSDEEGTTKEPSVEGETKNEDASDIIHDNSIRYLWGMLKSWTPFGYGPYGYYVYK